MSNTLCTLAILLLALPLRAADTIARPNKVSDFSALPFKTLAQKRLPPGIYFQVSQGAESNEDPEHTGPACYIDLNGDGRRELIVQSESKTSHIFEIFQKQKGHWVSILQVEGLASLLAKRKGYFQIGVETFYGDRHGNDFRELYTFSGNRYHIVRIEEYKDSTYLGTRDPKEAEELLERNYKEQFKHL